MLYVIELVADIIAHTTTQLECITAYCVKVCVLYAQVGLILVILIKIDSN